MSIIASLLPLKNKYLVKDALTVEEMMDAIDNEMAEINPLVRMTLENELNNLIFQLV